MGFARRIGITTITGVAALALSAALGACGGSAAPSQASAVAVKDFAFDRAEITVPAGTKVRFENTGATTHTVKGRGFFSEAINPGQTYEHRFTRPGTYRYLCTLHPTLMRGVITVSG